ncbi:MAG: 2Fe-2S iron-sulfur cluster binding domain-containing protein, partial [Oligosphaeraceae bacterium]|nr:2Fe-2S iron-sulfur cluster binding domain-containing protein [Oligosphaeraceae bacterium]
MRINITCKDNLAAVLQQSGHRLDLRCGGQGTCGRCRVELLSGTWEVEKRVVQAPGSALACRTRLLSDNGEVEFTPLSGKGQIASGWFSRPLPVRSETVLGVDIGTTTIAAVKVCHGEVIGRASCFNAQMEYGDNVLTRIGAAAGHLSALQAAVRSSVGGLLSEL